MRRASGTIHVFTFKEGVLARAAHDLRIRLERFVITLDGEELHAEFDLRSLFVDGPVESGVVLSEQFDAAQRAELEAAMHEHVLDTNRHPTARFVGTATPRSDGFDVRGELELAGRTAALPFRVRREGDTYRAVLDFPPSRWGIAPYRALLGAIRLKDLVRVEIALREDGHGV